MQHVLAIDVGPDFRKMLASSVYPEVNRSCPMLQAGFYFTYSAIHKIHKGIGEKSTRNLLGYNDKRV